MEQKVRYEKFTDGVSVLLGALMGLLVAIPLASTELRSSGAILVVGATVFGGLTGFRRRKSRAFLYFCLIGICVLSSLISFSLVGRG